MHRYFYLILLAVIVSQLFLFPEIKLGVVTSMIILIIMLCDMRGKDFFRNSLINYLLLIYILYNTISVALYAVNEMPLTVFVAEWSNSILPVFFFYFAKGEKLRFEFYRITLNAILVSFVMGFFLWVVESEMYRAFMDVTEGVGTDLLYFQSLFGLTATAVFGVIGYLISSSLFFETKEKRWLVSIIICSIAVVLTFRRSAALVLLLSIIFTHYICYFKYKFIGKINLIVEVVFIGAVFLTLQYDYSEPLGMFFERAYDVSEAINSRSDTWEYAYNLNGMTVGAGLGAFGHKALGYSSTLITDGNYHKLMAEIGLIGFAIFMLIIISTLLRCLLNLRHRYLEFGIVSAFSIIAIGSNVLTFQALAPLFWYAIGCVWMRSNQTLRMGYNLKHFKVGFTTFYKSE